MISKQNHVFLIDFGIAKNFKTGQKGTMIGTEGYSPPEQYRGEALPARIFMLWERLLHHLLTKRDPRLEPPFTFSERPIREFNTNVSVELETVIQTALQYDPQGPFPYCTSHERIAFDGCPKDRRPAQPVFSIHFDRIIRAER